MIWEEYQFWAERSWYAANESDRQRFAYLATDAAREAHAWS
jgi:hypothetical protein